MWQKWIPIKWSRKVFTFLFLFYSQYSLLPTCIVIKACESESLLPPSDRPGLLQGAWWTEAASSGSSPAGRWSLPVTKKQTSIQPKSKTWPSGANAKYPLILNGAPKSNMTVHSFQWSFWRSSNGKKVLTSLSMCKWSMHSSVTFHRASVTHLIFCQSELSWKTSCPGTVDTAHGIFFAAVLRVTTEKKGTRPYCQSDIQFL